MSLSYGSEVFMKEVSNNPKFGIVTNTNRDNNLDYTKTLVSWLNGKNCNIFVIENVGKLKGTISASIKTMCENCDFIITLGGDGTMLEVAPTCAEYNVPMVGINLGSVGYLTDAEMSHGLFAIQKILNRDYKIEKRMLIETLVDGKVYTALNDICVIKGDTAKLITLNININGEYLDTYRADGIIISTPTGSTAYNLASGGPIIKPNVNTMVITPICPYKIYFRPVIVSGEDVLTISSQHDYSNVQIFIDGNSIKLNDKVDIKKSQKTVSIIRTSQQNFYDIFRKKFSVS